MLFLLAKNVEPSRVLIHSIVYVAAVMGRGMCPAGPESLLYVHTGDRCGESSTWDYTEQCVLGSRVVYSRDLQLSRCGIAVMGCIQLG